MIKENFNVVALRGGEMDDMEYVEEFELDPKVAYTPAINDAMLRKVHESNVEFYLESGDKASEAKAKADKNMSIARDNIKKLLKKNTM